MKNFKMISMILLGLAGSLGSAWAGDVPDGAELIAQGHLTDTQSCKDGVEYLTGISHGTSITNTGSFSVLGHSDGSSLDLEFECQDVYYKWNHSVEESDCGLFSFIEDAFSGEASEGCRKWDTFSLDVYCSRRSLQQKQTLSLERFCEQTPDAKCFDKDYLDYLGKLTPAKYHDIDQPGC